MPAPPSISLTEQDGTVPTLRDCEREIFRQHRFLGLPHGIVAVGPATLIALSEWRLALDLTHPLTWLLPAVAYLASMTILSCLLPSRDVLKRMAHDYQHAQLLLAEQRGDLVAPEEAFASSAGDPVPS